jgi:hypothetical protein
MRANSTPGLNNALDTSVAGVFDLVLICRSCSVGEFGKTECDPSKPSVSIWYRDRSAGSVPPAPGNDQSLPGGRPASPQAPPF